VTAALNKLKKTQAVFSTTDFTIDLGGLGKRMQLNSPSMKAVVVGNFNVSGINMVPGFQHTGTWYDYFSHTSFEVTDVNASFSYAPGEYHIYTDVQLDAPDLSTTVEEVMTFFGQKVAVYPNPAIDQLTVGFEMNQPGAVKVEIFDLTGRMVYQVAPRQMGNGMQSITFPLSGNGISEGTYIVKVTTPTQMLTEQVIIMN
jgi:hypothetical protein